MSAAPQPFLRSFGFALEGLVQAVRTQRNMRVHLASALLVCHVAIGVPLAGWAQVTLLGATAAVLFAELVNTSLEALVDLASPQVDPRAKVAKDAAAGAVLVLSIGSALALAAVLVAEAPTIFSDAWRIQRQALVGVPQVVAAVAPTVLARGPAQHAATLAAVALACATFAWAQAPLFVALLLLLTALGWAARRH